MHGKIIWQRILMCGAMVAATAVCMTGTANAATSTCFTQSYSDGAKIVPGTGGGHVTRSIARQQARNTWDDWVWRGEPYQCSRAGKDCQHSWGRSQSTTTSWSVGGGINIGNATSPSKKWYNPVASLVVGYQKSTTISSDFTVSVTIRPGQTAVPVQIAVRRWTQGDFVGGWVRTNRGCQAGTTYEWNGNAEFGSWTRNVFVHSKSSIAVDGRI